MNIDYTYFLCYSQQLLIDKLLLEIILMYLVNF